jgi:uncharacterized membrane protein YeaQ/YmgE (transglycosylase-associated protein family)
VDQRTRDLVVLGLIGLVAGYLASIIVGGSGLIRYLISGVIGAFVGPMLLRAFGVDLKIGNPLAAQVVSATIGAITVVILARFIG